MSKNLAIIITVISAATFLVVLFFSVSYAPNDEVVEARQTFIADKKNDFQFQSLVPIDEKKETKLLEKNSELASLYIPAIGVNAPIVAVGISKKGNIASPRSYDEVGWYKLGPLPGEAGTAILDGHVDNGLAQPGVFKNLEKLIIGDHLYIETNENQTLHFIVSQINVYDFDAPTEDIFVDSVEPSVLLITCTGDWQPLLKTHDKRLVVSAVLAES